MIEPFDALGNATRRQILAELRSGPLSVNELADRFPVSRPAISRHLSVLEEAGLVEQHSDGARHLYSVNLAGFGSVRDYLDSFWDLALSRLSHLADHDRPR